ncbi:MAG: 3'(2'),5'-bisphosphate nucleotidase CysQ, partial [Sedimenticolaceae bacterium]
MDKQALQLLDIARAAGQAILEVYHQDFSVEQKDDDSPLTAADLASNRIIVQRLRELDPTVPILSEEGADIPYPIRSQWQHYWLIDPLDGTREFVKRNGEFTVNIALIENGRPVAGVV